MIVLFIIQVTLTGRVANFSVPRGNSFYLLNGVNIPCLSEAANCPPEAAFETLHGGDSKTLDGTEFGGITLA
jgi:hypothetical protein